MSQSLLDIGMRTTSNIESASVFESTIVKPVIVTTNRPDVPVMNKKHLLPATCVGSLLHNAVPLADVNSRLMAWELCCLVTTVSCRK